MGEESRPSYRGSRGGEKPRQVTKPILLEALSYLRVFEERRFCFEKNGDVPSPAKRRSAMQLTNRRRCPVVPSQLK
jgi:hypothetical protein